jgi:hypothetical protein
VEATTREPYVEQLLELGRGVKACRPPVAAIITPDMWEFASRAIWFVLVFGLGVVLGAEWFGNPSPTFVRDGLIVVGVIPFAGIWLGQRAAQERRDREYAELERTFEAQQREREANAELFEDDEDDRDGDGE